MDNDEKTSISQVDTDEEIGEFWDTHDFTVYYTDAPGVDFVVTIRPPAP